MPQDRSGNTGRNTGGPGHSEPKTYVPQTRRPDDTGDVGPKVHDDTTD